MRNLTLVPRPMFACSVVSVWDHVVTSCRYPLHLVNMPPPYESGSVFRAVIQCSSVQISRRFGSKLCIYLHGYFHFFLGSPSRCALMKHEIAEKYSRAQQLFYNYAIVIRCNFFPRRVSTLFPSHPQALCNLRLITVKYLRNCVLDLIGLQYLSE
jgi:hypothetical protein